MKVLISLLLAIMFLGGHATAEEGNICDGQVGAAYGLCNAYCHAMDCASPDPLASDLACDRVSNLYEQITASLPPCETSTPVVCPGWTHEELAITYARICNYDDVYDNAIGTSGACDTLYDCCDDGPGIAEASVGVTDCHNDTNQLQYYERSSTGEIYHDITIEITADEYTICESDIYAHAFELCP